MVGKYEGQTAIKIKEVFEKAKGKVLFIDEASRVPFSINFRDYSSKEMEEIVELEAKRRGFSVALEATEKITSICRVTTGNPEAGNGRLCRNIVKNAIIEYALRVYGEDGNSENKNHVLEARDFTIPTNSQ